MRSTGSAKTSGSRRRRSLMRGSVPPGSQARRSRAEVAAATAAAVAVAAAVGPQDLRAACMAAMNRPAMPGDAAKLANRVVARLRPTTKPSVRVVPSGMPIW